jgi:hypothetical protein
MKRCSALIFLLLFGACASSTSDLSTPKPGSQEVIVTGRVDVVLADKPSFWVFIVPQEGGKAWDYRVTGDGTFFWYLPPGNYEIPSFQGQRGTERTGGQVLGRFKVPAGKAAVYIGTLTITFSKGGRYGIKIFDDFDAGGFVKLKQKFPEMKKEDVAKNLIILGGR